MVTKWVTSDTKQLVSVLTYFMTHDLYAAELRAKIAAQRAEVMNECPLAIVKKLHALRNKYKYKFSYAMEFLNVIYYIWRLKLIINLFNQLGYVIMLCYKA